MSPRSGAWMPFYRGPVRAAISHDRAARALVAAAVARDEPGLRRMLDPGVELTVDGGGVVAAPDSPLSGTAEVGRQLAGVLCDPQVSLRVAFVNGMPAIVISRDVTVTGVLGIRVRRRLIVQAWLVVNPEKLTRWNAD